jgi:hypothetical protein
MYLMKFINNHKIKKDAMKVKTIEQDKENRNVYIVTLTPNWLERLFGKKEEEEKYKKITGETYLFGGGNIYRGQDGRDLRNGNYIGDAIDMYIKKW